MSVGVLLGFRFLALELLKQIVDFQTGLRRCIYIYIYIKACVHVYMCIYIYTYVHTYILRRGHFTSSLPGVAQAVCLERGLGTGLRETRSVVRKPISYYRGLTILGFLIIVIVYYTPKPYSNY